MSIKYLAPIILSIVVLSCDNSKSNRGASNTTNQEIKSEGSTSENDVKRAKDEAIYNPVDSSEDFFKIINARYQFSFHIPKTWRAFDKSGNGDGFFVKIPDSDSVDIRIFGEQINPAIEDFYWQNCNPLENFAFSDTLRGKRCIEQNEITYSLDHREKRIIIYVKNYDLLPIHDKVNFTSTLKSLRLIPSSPKKST